MKKQERHRQSTFQKWIPVIGLIFIIGFFGSMMWSGNEYSNAAIIAKYFESSSNNETDIKIIDQTPETNKLFLEHQSLLAENFYKNNNFAKAIEVYDLVLKNKNNTAYDLSNIDFESIEWNRVLMFLGNDDRTKTLETIDTLTSSDIPEKYKSKGLALKEEINSFWYGWAN